MIGLDLVFLLLGLMFVAVAALTLRDRTNPRRFTSAAFWALFALSFLAGKWIGDIANGLIAMALAGIAGLGGLGKGAGETTSVEVREASAARFGLRLLLPALLIPLAALLGSLFLKYVVVGGRPLVDPKQATFVALAFGVMLALATAVPMLRARPAEPVVETRRLVEAVGWAILLPQMLAALGAVFALAGVGKMVGDLASHYLPLSTPFAAVCAYTVGMAAFTIVMGNAFAAFPVMTAGIGLPLIVQKFGGDPAVVGAVGMLSGFCGTLLTPMAANFNLIPAALLDLPRYAVIRAQAPTAGLMLIVNTALMYLLAFHK
jgi:uncharacterized membrane protein